MSNRHLPAGQNLQGGGQGAWNMADPTAPMQGGGGGGGRYRRRSNQQPSGNHQQNHQNHHNQQHNQQPYQNGRNYQAQNVHHPQMNHRNMGLNGSPGPMGANAYAAQNQQYAGHMNQQFQQIHNPPQAFHPNGYAQNMAANQMFGNYNQAPGLNSYNQVQNGNYQHHNYDPGYGGPAQSFNYTPSQPMPVHNQQQHQQAVGYPYPAPQPQFGGPPMYMNGPFPPVPPLYVPHHHLSHRSSPVASYLPMAGGPGQSMPGALPAAQPVFAQPGARTVAQPSTQPIIARTHAQPHARPAAKASSKHAAKAASKPAAQPAGPPATKPDAHAAAAAATGPQPPAHPAAEPVAREVTQPVAQHVDESEAHGTAPAAVQHIIESEAHGTAPAAVQHIIESESHGTATSAVQHALLSVPEPAAPASPSIVPSPTRCDMPGAQIQSPMDCSHEQTVLPLSRAASTIVPETPSSTRSSEVSPAPASCLLPLVPTGFPGLGDIVEAAVAPNEAPGAPPGPFRLSLPWKTHPDVDFPARKAPVIIGKWLLEDIDKVSLPIGRLDTPELKQDMANMAKAIPPQATGQDTLPEDDQGTAVASSSRQSIDSAAGFELSSASVTPDLTPPASVTAAEPAVPAKPSVTPTRPMVPALPRRDSTQSKPETSIKTTAAAPGNNEVRTEESPTEKSPTEKSPTDNASTPSAPPALDANRTWSSLLKKGPKAAEKAAEKASDGEVANGSATSGALGVANGTAHFSKMGDVIHSFKVQSDGQVSLLEPRGLVNTGNMCYMNAVLQLLLHCTPFYRFLDEVGKKSAHDFKGEAPLIGQMILFIREFKVLRTLPLAQQQARSLKPEELDHFGEPLTTEFLCEKLKNFPRFASMTRGAQQDAEEFLGFLFQTLDDECTSSLTSSGHEGADASDTSPKGTNPWLEVGAKQRAVVTRLSGHSTPTPVTKIFGGLLRSELRMHHTKESVTTERYQALQLDIGAPEVNNVVDALVGLTRSERLQGDFTSPSGQKVPATKQVLIESLPPVLILHLKRFQFDGSGRGTVKIGKKIGYPLDLEIPRDALSRNARQSITDGSLPRYKLTGVVYHHGKSASGGHYTVDVRRQDGKEWISIDDTVIRRVRGEDVAQAVSKSGASTPTEDHDEAGWKRVAPTGAKKQWSSVVNGTANGAAKGKHAKDDNNRAAYLLFYERI